MAGRFVGQVANLSHKNNGQDTILTCSFVLGPDHLSTRIAVEGGGLVGQVANLSYKNNGQDTILSHK